MIRLTLLLALLPSLAAAAGGEPVPAATSVPKPADEAQVFPVTVPKARHLLPVEITDRMRAALVVKMGGPPPQHDEPSHDAKPTGH
ncbi:MAG: hypothetical protein KDK24_13945 [Pseudooceanicola sp.]|nr:hypothetical protein [Pseudooceanicola sp.]